MARGPPDDATGVVERGDIPLDLRTAPISATNANDIISAILNGRELGPGPVQESRIYKLAAFFRLV
jgi:hypothetical protein